MGSCTGSLSLAIPHKFQPRASSLKYKDHLWSGLRSGTLVFCCLKPASKLSISSGVAFRVAQRFCAAVCFEHISEHFVTFLGETEHLIQRIKCGIKVKHFSGGKLEITKKQKQRKRPHANSYPEGFSLRKWRPSIFLGKSPEDEVGTPALQFIKIRTRNIFFTVVDLKKI